MEDEMKESERIKDEMEEVTELVNETVPSIAKALTDMAPAIAQLGSAAGPVVNTYLALLFESDSFKQLKKEGQLMTLAVAFIEAGANDPAVAATRALVCYRQLFETEE